MRRISVKDDNRGASLLAVLILMVVVSAIAIVITKITIVNIQMKEVERGTKKNFYSADAIMDDLRTGAREQAETALENAYADVLQHYVDYTGSGKNVQDVFKQNYMNGLEKYFADPMKTKQLNKGIEQLMDEGVAQLFFNQFNGRKIIGTVGQLQFEVIQYRLLHEYGAQCRWEPISLYKACWIESEDEAALEAFKKRKHQFMALDREGRDVFLADSGYVLQMAQTDFPKIKFHFTSEF